MLLVLWFVAAAVWTYFFLDELMNRSSYDHGQSSYTIPVLNFVAGLVATVTLAALAVLVFRGSTQDATQIFRLVALAGVASVVLAIAALFFRVDSATLMIGALTAVSLGVARTEVVRDWCSW